MKTLISAMLIMITQVTSASPNSAQFNYTKFANNYFKIWTATQSPNATESDLENYLALLTEDVGHQHFPHDMEDHRNPSGKSNIREGMMHYLAAHKTYSAKLLSITYGASVIAIKYEAKATYMNQKDELAAWQHTMLEILELENGKVAVIRKYSE